MPERGAEKPPFLKVRKNSPRCPTGAWFAPQNRLQGEFVSIALQEIAVNLTIKYPLMH
jgi:hypothetical protein